LVNVVEKTFEIPLLQMDLFHSNCPWFFVCFCTWSEEDKLYYLCLIVTPSEDDIISQSLLMLTWPRVWIIQMFYFFRVSSEFDSFKGLYPSEFGSELYLVFKFQMLLNMLFQYQNLI